MKKWVLAIFLVFFIMLGMLPGTAWAAEVNSGTCGADGDNLTWSLDSDGTLTISGTGKMADYGISDEAELAPPWYKERSSIKSAVIVNGVVSIGDSAFEGCNNLANVTIPDSVTSIGEYAFADCNRLTSVIIPDSVTSIRDSAFNYCNSLTSITIPDSVTKIEGNVFASCEQLTTVLVGTENTSYTAQDNVLFNKDMTELIGYPAGNVKEPLIKSR